MRIKPLLFISLLSFLLLIISFPISTADFAVSFFIPERIELILSTEIVDLGLPLGRGPFYYEKKDSVRINFRCNIPADWEVRVYADDFRDGDKTIPISRLEWRSETGAYQYMPAVGSYGILARRRDYPSKKAGRMHSKSISYRLQLRGDESGGFYSAPIIYTLFVP